MAEAELSGPGQVGWLDRLEQEHDNLRAALRWVMNRARRGDVFGAERALRLVGSLGRFWEWRGYLAEGQDRLSAALTEVSEAPAEAHISALVGALRLEYLDHFIVLDEHQLSAVLREYVGYYNQDRPHRTLGLQTPEPRQRPRTGPIRSRPVLHGLHHVYERAA